MKTNKLNEKEILKRVSKGEMHRINGGDGGIGPTSYNALCSSLCEYKPLVDSICTEPKPPIEPINSVCLCLAGCSCIDSACTRCNV